MLPNDVSRCHDSPCSSSMTCARWEDEETHSYSSATRNARVVHTSSMRGDIENKERTCRYYIRDEEEVNKIEKYLSGIKT